MSASSKHVSGKLSALARASWTAVYKPPWRNVLALGLFGLAFFVAYRYAMAFSQATASPFWFPDSILLCALLLAPPRWWPLLLLATLPIRLFSPVSAGLPLWFLLATFAIDSAKGLLAAGLLRRFLDNPLRFETVREFARYAVIAVLLVPALAAFGGATARHFLGHEFWPAWIQWFSGNALTHLVITPVILYWVIGAAWRGPWPSARRWAEAALLAVALVVTTNLAFAGALDGAFAHSRFYAPIPFLVWAAVRFGMLGATGGIAVAAFMAVEAALTGQVSFSGKSAGEAASALQEFLFVRAAPLYLVAVLFDQMKRTERSLRDSEQRYREVVNTQTDLVCRFRPDTTLTFVNSAYCRYFGRKPEELIGTRFLDLIPEEARSAALRQLEIAAARQASNTYEHEVNLPSGGLGWQQWTDYPIFNASGQITEYQSIGHDITDRKRAEEASQNLAHASRLASVGELTAMIAHEITQPLSAVLSNAQTAARLLETREPPLNELREIVADICNDNLRAAQAVSRIHNLARNRSINLQPLDLNEAVKDVLQLTAADALRRKVRVVAQLDPNLPWVSGDRIHLQQVLLNLIVNAMDAMSEVTSQARQLTVQTKPRQEGGRREVEVAVIDHGPGIPPHRLTHIFQSFFTTKPDGMGIGLAIARSIIQAHRGRIWAENGLDEGATFRFVLQVVERESASQYR